MISKLILSTLISIVFALTGCSDPSSSSSPSSDRVTTMGLCKSKIKASLWDSSSFNEDVWGAKFDKITVSNNEYRISYITSFTATNAYGATIENRFSCEVLFNQDTDRYRLVALDLY